jgi:hypothetical protein
MTTVFRKVVLATTIAIEVILHDLVQLNGIISNLMLDGSYYYKNGDNSTYYNDGQGGATYTAPDGKVYKK